MSQSKKFQSSFLYDKKRGLREVPPFTREDSPLGGWRRLSNGKWSQRVKLDGHHAWKTYPANRLPHEVKKIMMEALLLGVTL